MEIEQRDRRRMVTFILSAGFLAAMAAGLIAVFSLTVHGATTVADDKTRKLLARLAWLSMAMLCLTIVVLFWLVTRFFLQKLKGESHHAPTEYVDAWSLAGQRAKPEPEAPEEGDEGQEEDEEDRPIV